MGVKSVSTVEKNPPDNKARRFMIRLVNAKYSVPSWLWALASTSVGLLILFYAITNPVLIAEFVKPLPFEGFVWGSLLGGAGVVAMLGMGLDKARLVRIGSFLSFCMWIFGAVSFYAAGGIGNIIIFAGPMLIYWAYKYLASYVREFPRM
jgi:hypothetical protein